MNSLTKICQRLPRALFVGQASLINRNFFNSTLRFSENAVVVDNANSLKQITEENQEGKPDILYRKIHLELRGNEPAVLKSYVQFAMKSANYLGIPNGESWSEPQQKQRYTLLKSVHVHRKHMVQYEYRTYFQFMKFPHLTGSTAETFLEYIQRNLPEGISMRVTKTAIEQLPQHLIPPTN